MAMSRNSLADANTSSLNAGKANLATPLEFLVEAHCVTMCCTNEVSKHGFNAKASLYQESSNTNDTRAHKARWSFETKTKYLFCIGSPRCCMPTEE